MHTEDFMGVLTLGLMMGSALTLLIQFYGRRKVKQAMNAAQVEAERKISLLAGDNDRQAGQMDRLQERLAVLERITIDPAHRTAREIESLR
ncbi:hypothetical protein [Sphingomonas sp.]|uniref:hypothetical protein n=1 Tax=Sphingomonas sp. TaxID=28214 RepID=UPI002DD6B10D|nr:hypothetical protein [Sphingomonas sp.]